MIRLYWLKAPPGLQKLSFACFSGKFPECTRYTYTEQPAMIPCDTNIHKKTSGNRGESSDAIVPFYQTIMNVTGMEEDDLNDYNEYVYY